MNRISQKNTYCLALLLFACFIGGCASQPKPQPAVTTNSAQRLDDMLNNFTPPPGAFDDVQKSSPDDLAAIFTKNPLNAKQELDGKWVVVEGVLTSGPRALQTQGLIHSYTLILSGKSSQLPCIFMGSNKKESLKALTTGSRITVNGKIMIRNTDIILIGISVSESAPAPAKK